MDYRTDYSPGATRYLKTDGQKILLAVVRLISPDNTTVSVGARQCDEVAPLCGVKCLTLI
jgi:hypothetical protein